MYTTLALAQLQSLEITAAAFMVDLVQLMGGNLSDMATRLLADGLPNPCTREQAAQFCAQHAYARGTYLHRWGQGIGRVEGDIKAQTAAAAPPSTADEST